MKPEIVLTETIDLTENDDLLIISTPTVLDFPVVSKAVILAVQMLDINGRKLDPPNGFLKSNRFGPFKYLHGKMIRDGFELKVPVSEGCARVELSIYGWAVDASTIADQVRIGTLVKVSASEISESCPVDMDELDFRFDVRPGETYAVCWQAEAIDRGQGLLLFEYRSQEDELLMPPSELLFSPKFGSYSYAIKRDRMDKQNCILQIPYSAHSLRIRGKNWGGGGAKLVGPLLVGQKTPEDQTIERSFKSSDWFSSIKDTDDLAIFYSLSQQDSEVSALATRSTMMARGLAEHGWKVVSVSAEIQHEPVVSNSILILPIGELRRAFNRLGSERRMGRSVLICSSRSDIQMLSITDRAHAQGWHIIYDYLGGWEIREDTGSLNWYRTIIEKRIVDSSDLVLSTNSQLIERLETNLMARPPVLLRNSVSFSGEEQVVLGTKVREEHSPKEGTVVGYLGDLSDSWVDWPLLLRAIKARPNVRFEFLGFGLPETIKLPVNAQYTVFDSWQSANRAMQKWKIGLIPLVPSRETASVDPSLVYDYIAAGLRTLSIPTGGIQNYPGVKLYRNENEFLIALDRLLSAKTTDTFLEDCRRFTSENSWSMRMSQFCDLIESLN